MPSTLSEPIGPRSPDDILAVVYRRTEHVRRRRRQQLVAAAGALALGVAALVSALPGDDEAARVRVVDDRTARTEETQESATATTVAGSAEPPSDSDPTTTTTTTTASKRNPPSQPSSPVQASAPTTVPPLPTTTLPGTVDSGPSMKLLAQEADRQGDSSPGDWYYDIVHGSMHVDLRNDTVLFTTRYRTPDTSGSRNTRTLRTSFDYDNSPVAVSVTESGNALGEVSLNGGECAGCTAELDESQGELTVTVPTATMDAYLETLFGDGASIEHATVSNLDVTTTSVDLQAVEGEEQPADESGTVQ
ncbi:MAG: DUF4349 domain-containing protein [Actinomycetota bacterium]|nr:DUF4349 domain-containing protein [Actinomycetota bacterium]